MQQSRSLIVSILMLASIQAGTVRGEDAECAAWCARAEAECGRSVRESRQACAQRAATAGVDPLTRRRDNGVFLCGWFQDAGYCDNRWAGVGCADRLQARLDLCLDAYAPDTASEYLACSAGEREALALCRAELGDCKAQCR